MAPLDTIFSSLAALMEGLGLVIALLVPTFALGFVLSLALAKMRLSRRRLLRWPADLFAVFFRGVPMLVVLYMVYYGFPQLSVVRDTWLWAFFREPVYCAIFVFTINHAAFLCEIWRGALRAVPKGLTEASQSLGIGPVVHFFKIEFPLAFRLAISGYRNEIVMFVKSTATVGAIAVVDILAAANDLVQKTFDPLTPLLAAALVYWLMVQVLQLGFDRLEHRLRLVGQGAGR